MAIRHQETSIADSSGGSRCASTVDRDTFAYEVMVSDDDVTLARPEFHILRVTADDCVLVDARLAADRRVPLDHCVGGDAAAGFDDHVFFYYCIRTDLHVCAQLGFGVDAGTAMNCAHGFIHAKPAFCPCSLLWPSYQSAYKLEAPGGRVLKRL
jgi:hypothetical protein